MVCAFFMLCVVASHSHSTELLLLLCSGRKIFNYFFVRRSSDARSCREFSIHSETNFFASSKQGKATAKIGIIFISGEIFPLIWHASWRPHRERHSISARRRQLSTSLSEKLFLSRSFSACFCFFMRFGSIYIFSNSALDIVSSIQRQAQTWMKKRESNASLLSNAHCFRTMLLLCLDRLVALCERYSKSIRICQSSRANTRWKNTSDFFSPVLLFFFPHLPLLLL